MDEIFEPKDQIEREIYESISKEASRKESEQLQLKDFYRMVKKGNYFSTISAWVDFNVVKEKVNPTEYNYKNHIEYNNRANKTLESEFKRLGLAYRKTLGVWKSHSDIADERKIGGRIKPVEEYLENSYLVYSGRYTEAQFISIMLKLAKEFRQWAVCIGKKDLKTCNWDIDVYGTDSLDRGQIYYKITDHYSHLKEAEAVSMGGTILTRKIRSSSGEIQGYIFKPEKRYGEDPDKFRDNSKTSGKMMVFEGLQLNPVLAYSNTRAGELKRKSLYKEILSRGDDWWNE